MQINGNTITYNGNNDYSVNGRHASIAALRSDNLKVWGGEVFELTAAERAAVLAEYEALLAERRAIKAAPRKPVYSSRNARGVDGRGNRVNDGAEWTWGR